MNDSLSDSKTFKFKDADILVLDRAFLFGLTIKFYYWIFFLPLKILICKKIQ